MRLSKALAAGVASGVIGLAGASAAFAHDDGTAHPHGGAGAPTGDLRDLVSDLYGGNGITLDAVGHEAHFSADSQAALNNLGAIIAANLGTYSFNSTVSAVSFDVEQGIPVRVQESLGPVLAERAKTIGRNRINLAVSYSMIDYRQLDGVDLDDLTLDLSHLDVPGDSPFERDVIRLNLDLKIKQELLAVFGTYGLTDNIDVSLVVPMVRMDASVTSVAQIIYNGGDTSVHQFGAVSPISSNGGSATGLGDVSVRAKWHVTSGMDTPVQAAVVGRYTFATGDDSDLLGTGSPSGYLGAVASAHLGRVNPHLNVGYEHYFDEDDSAFERSNTRLVAGFDIAASDRISISTEFLGRWESDGDTYYDYALGAKWEAFKGVPIIANVIFPINRDEGLRPDYVFMMGMETTF